MTRQQAAFVAAAFVLLAIAMVSKGVACREWSVGDHEGDHQQHMPDDGTLTTGRSLLQASNAIVQTTGYNGVPVMYVVYKTAAPIDWRTAYKACATTKTPSRNSYMVLASITSATASAAIHTAARGLGLAINPPGGGIAWGTGYWIGLNDITTEGTFTYPYSAGAPANAFTVWYPNEPNDSNMMEDCGQVVSNPANNQAAWNDIRCLDQLSGYVCQEIPGAPQPPMPGGAPGIVGPTGGLYSGIAAGVSVDANAARANCEASGTWLVKINSAAENAFVRTTFFPTQNLELGATDTAVEGTWRWVADNSPLTYTNWAPGEPNNSWNEDYLMMYLSGAWNDHGGTGPGGANAYVCWVPSF